MGASRTRMEEVPLGEEKGLVPRGGRGEAAQSKFHFSLLHYAPGEKGKEKTEVEEEIWPSQLRR